MKYEITIPMFFLTSKKIHCIKFYRYMTGAGLKESKETIEDMAAKGETSFIHEDARDIETLRKIAREESLSIVVERARCSRPINGSFSVDTDGICTLEINQGNNSLNMMIEYSNLQATLDFFNTYCVPDKEEE